VKRTITFLFENSLFLILGAATGLLWANLDHSGYETLLHLPLWENDWIGPLHGAHRVVDVHYLVNDMLMAVFFAIAGKEVWESFLPGGALSNPRKAATPLIATLGGVAVPAAVYLGGAAAIGQLAELGRGWAIPCATDIAFSYLVARLIFGAGHAAIPFLLLLAIADDAIGLIILAVFYPQEEIRPAFMLLLRVASFWPYLLIGGTMSWLGFALSGLHPALGFLPIIPVMPHAHVDRGLFDWREYSQQDTLNEFEHWWKNPVELILGAFGLLNAGVVLSSVGAPTVLVLGGLLLGKPIGIWAFGVLAARGLGFDMPSGLRLRDLVTIGCAAAIGFTVSLFVATVAFPAGPVQDAAKMGALASFGAVLLTWVAARVIGVERADGSHGGDPSR
jgi:NhaA family Na+:H+ antiporter